MKKSISRALSLLLVLVMVLGMAPMALASDTPEDTTPDNPEPTAYSVMLLGAGTVKHGKTLTLTADVGPSVPNGAVYNWTATAGTISGSGNSATYTAPATGTTATVAVTVTFTHPQTTETVSISDSAVITLEEVVKPTAVNVTNLTIYQGQTAQLQATVTPADATQTVIWERINNNQYLTVSNGGTVTAARFGGSTEREFTVRAMAVDKGANGNDVIGEGKITIKPSAYTISGSVSPNPIPVGGTGKLTVTAKHNGTSTSNYSVNVTSGNDVIDLSGETVTAKKIGKATIKVTVGSLSGDYATAEIPVEVRGVSLECKNGSTTVGQVLNLAPSVTLGNGTLARDVKYEVTTSFAVRETEGTVSLYSSTAGAEKVTIKVLSYKDQNGNTQTGTSDLTKEVWASFYKTNDMSVYLKDGVSSFRFNKDGIAQSVSGKLWNAASLKNVTMAEIITMAIPSSNQTVRYYAFEESSSAGGELLQPSSATSWTSSSKIVNAANLGTVGFTQTSSSKKDSTITVLALMDNSENVILGALSLTISAGKVSGIEYTAAPGKSVTFKEYDFEKYWNSQMDDDYDDPDLEYVQFDQPADGTLYATKTVTGSKKVIVDSLMKFYVSGSNVTINNTRTFDLDGVTYVPKSSTTKSYVTVPFTAYGDGESLSGVVVINLDENSGAITSIGISMEAAADIIAERFEEENDEELGYVVFDLLDVEEGTLYRSISRTGGKYDIVGAFPVIKGEKFYYEKTGNKDLLEDVYLVPAADFSGEIEVKYTAYDNNGRNATEDEISCKVKTLTASKEFSDVNANSYSWASDAVDFLSHYGIAQGSNGKYRPGDAITRGDFMLMLYRAFLEADYASVNVTSNFPDMKNTTDYEKETYKAVGIAKQLGIAQGTNNKFNPKANITREDAMVLLHRTLEKVNRTLRYDSNTYASKFSDYSKVGSWAKEAIDDLVDAGVVRGNNNKINPKDSITRAEMAVSLHRAITY